MRITERLHCDLTAVGKGLRSSRWLLIVAVMTLAAGIGMNGAMLGLVDRALLSPPRQLGAPEELYLLAFESTGGGPAVRMSTTSYPTFRTIRDQVPAVALAAAWQNGPSAVTVDGEQVDARTVLVSSAYFALLQSHPRIGRAAFDEGARVVVISDAFWSAAFGRDPGILGRRIVVRGVDFQVAAVMPAGFSGHAPNAVDAWLPIEEVMRGVAGWDNPFRNAVSIVARVHEGQLAAAAAQSSAATERRVVFSPMVGAGIGEQEKRIALWLMGLAALVLVIALANAGTLLLVRAARRKRESAIRAALGASRGRLLWHLAVEALLVALAAAAVSLLLGGWLDEAVRKVLLPSVIPSDRFDGLAAAAAAAAGLVAAAIAFAAGSVHLASAQRPDAVQGSRGSRSIFQRSLLVVQAALSVLLLAGAGMFGRSLYGLMHQDFGFTTDGVLLVDFEGPGAVPEQAEIFTTALDTIRRTPGVELATVYQSMPFGNFHVPPIAIPGLPEPPSVGQQLPYLIASTPEFLEILGIHIVEGRAFSRHDEGGAPVVIVNETMARTVWPGQSALGKCIRIGFDPDFDPMNAIEPPTPSTAVPCREVVGVARDVRQRSVVPEGNEARFMQYYVPFSQIPAPPAAVGPGPGVAGLLVKASGAAPVSGDTLRRILTAGRSDLPPARVRTYASLLERQVRPWQLGVTLLALFSALAVLLAAVGLYASFAHVVVLRRREMAIRIAIGATPSAVRSLILRDAVVLTLLAAAAGCAGALLAGRSLASLLYGIVAADPAVLGGAAGLMCAVAIAATALPALAASRSDPNTLLRVE